METETAVLSSNLKRNAVGYSPISAVQNPMNRFYLSPDRAIDVLDEGIIESIENLAMCCKSGPARLR